MSAETEWFYNRLERLALRIFGKAMAFGSAVIVAVAYVNVAG